LCVKNFDIELQTIFKDARVTSFLTKAQIRKFHINKCLCWNISCKSSNYECFNMSYLSNVIDCKLHNPQYSPFPFLYGLIIRIPCFWYHKINSLTSEHLKILVGVEALYFSYLFPSTVCSLISLVEWSK
jgi:hypothetical protein